MALESLTNKITQNCNGALTDFDFTFPITEAADLEVILTLVATGVETTLTLTTDYTVTASSNDFANGGTVSTVATYSSAYTITIYRNVALTQPSTFTENMQTLYQTFEDGLNRLTMQNQAQEERIESSLKTKKSDSDADLELPIAADRASRYLAFDASGEPIASSGSPDSDVPVSSFMETVLDDETALEVSQTLELEKGVDVQAYDADLALLAGITVAANQFIAKPSAGALAAKTITDFALSLLDDAAATNARTTLELAYASQAQMETPASATLVVSPLNTNFHPGVAKCWCKWNAAGAISASHNITDITDNGTGDWTINIATDFSSANWAYSLNVETGGAAGAMPDNIQVVAGGQAAGTLRVTNMNTTDGVNERDGNAMSFIGFGDQ